MKIDLSIWRKLSFFLDITNQNTFNVVDLNDYTNVKGMLREFLCDWRFISPCLSFILIFNYILSFKSDSTPYLILNMQILMTLVLYKIRKNAFFWCDIYKIYIKMSILWFLYVKLCCISWLKGTNIDIWLYSSIKFFTHHQI